MVMLLLRRTFAVGSIVLVLLLAGVVCCIMPACNNSVPKLLFANINNTITFKILYLLYTSINDINLHIPNSPTQLLTVFNLVSRYLILRDEG